LEHEIQIANKKLNDYELTIISMEQDMLNIQKAWHQQNQRSRINVPNFETKSVQVATAIQTVSIQTDSYNCCSNKEIEDSIKETESSKNIQESVESNKMIEKIFREIGSNTEESGNLTIYNEQLDEVLKLTSEGSVISETYLIEYKVKLDALNKAIEEKDSQYQAKIDALNKIIEEKDLYFAEKQNTFDELMGQSCIKNIDCADKLALKSTINSLQKLITQKEGTISRYQNLLKEDRDEHNRVASHLQNEIRTLHNRILVMQNETKKDEESVITVKNDLEKASKFNEDISRTPMSNIAQEELLILREKVSTLEAELNISKELSERWHQLAEERLKYMDRTRERFI